MDNISELIQNGIKIRQTEPNAALEIFKNTLAKSVEQNDERYLAESQFNLAVVYLILNDYANSLKHFTNALSCSYCDKEPMMLAEVLRGFAVIHLRTYNYHDALKYLYKSEQVSLEAKHYLNLHNLYGDFSALFYKLKQNEKAFEYTRKGLEIAEKTGDPYLLQYSVMSIGACYAQNNEYEKAEKYLEKSLTFNTNKFSETNALYLLSNIKFDQKKYRESLSFAVKQIRLSRKFHYREYEALGISRIAEILFERNKPYNAAAVYMKAIKIAEQINDKLINLSIYKKLIKVYEQTGNDKTLIGLYKKVSDYHEDYIEKESRLLAEHNSFHTEFEKIKKEAETERQLNIKLQNALAEVKVLNNRLDLLNSEKNELMAVAVHDLKNPLVNITAAARMIARYSSDENINVFTNEITSHSDKMFNLINKLLNHNAIEQGKITIKKTSFPAADLCREVIENYRDSAGMKNIKIHFRNALKDEILCTDYMVLYQIIGNLLSNAIKFSPENKNIYFEAEKENDYLIINVKDEGPGFSEQDKSKVFTKFSRLSAKPTKGEHSTGLGLAISKKLSDLVNAELSMESVFGQGSKFILKIKKTECE